MSEASIEKTENLAHAAVRGTSWTYIAFYSGKLIVFISTIVLARLLTKDDFGVVGYAITFIGFLDVVKDLGISSSVIYYKHNENEKFADTAFWLSIGIGIGLYVCVLLGSPFVGVFFHDPRASLVMKVSALVIPLNALGSTHEALLIKNLEFGKKFIPDFARAMTKGIISISFAFMGFGPWSLVFGQLIGTFVSSIILWRLTIWRPAFVFSSVTARALLSFGVPLVGMDLVSAFALNIDYLLVGRYLGSESLGVYTLAFRIPELTVLQFCIIVAQVIFPIFNKIRDDTDALKRGFLEASRYVAIITVPLGLGMAILSGPFILTFFGSKWQEAIPVMQAISIYSLVISLGFNAGDVFKAQGRPGMLMRISIIHTLLLAPILYWAVKGPASIVIVGWAQAILAFIVSVIYLSVALYMLEMPLKSILEALQPPLIPGIGLVCAVLAVTRVIATSPAWCQLIVGVLTGAITYLAILYWIERRFVKDAIQIARTVLLAR